MKEFRLERFSDATQRDGAWIFHPQWQDNPILFVATEGADTIFGVTRDPWNHAQLMKKFRQADVISCESSDETGRVAIRMTGGRRLIVFLVDKTMSEKLCNALVLVRT